MKRLAGDALEERLLLNSVRDGDCLRWQGARSSEGYGHLRIGGDGEKKAVAHRLAYELFVGPIPAGMEIDHLCRVRECIEPTHLEPVTTAENQARRTLTAEEHLSRSVAMGSRPEQMLPTTEERFWSKVHKDGECWLWVGDTGLGGHGWFAPSRGEYVRAHEFAYVLLGRHVPEGKQLSHECGAPTCVRAEHMAIGDPVPAVTLKTHCIRGHEFTEENTTWSFDRRRGKDRRHCRACRTAAQRAKRNGTAA